MIPADTIIILSRPAESGNVGAVCRAMKNMGLSRLRIAAPEAPLDDAVIRTRAVHAADIWDNAGHFDTLKQAVADCSLVIGTTRRRGEGRKNISLTPRETAGYIVERPGTCALVFGNERTGLEKDELDLCSIASHIPANDDFPSLNLSHAVQIYAYELFSVIPREPVCQWVPVDRDRLDSAVKVTSDSLEAIGFYKQYGREDQERFFRDILSRAGITLKETRYLEGLFRKITSLVRKGGLDKGLRD